MSANKLRDKIRRIVDKFGQEWWAAEECQHEKDLDTHQVEGQMVDAILEAVKSSLPEEKPVGIPTNDNFHYLEQYKGYNAALKDVRELLK